MIDEKTINEMMKDSRFFRLNTVCAYLNFYLCVLCSVVVVVDVDVDDVYDILMILLLEFSRCVCRSLLSLSFNKLLSIM